MNGITRLPRLLFPLFFLCAALIVQAPVAEALPRSSTPASDGSPAAPADTPTFTDVSVAAGVFQYHLGWGGAWGDYDGDGFIDLATVGHMGDICQLWHSNGDGTFTDVTTAAGMLTANGDAHGPCWADLDNDGDLDLYIAKGTSKVDKPQNFNNLWRNNGDGTFTDVAKDSNVTGLHCPARGATAVDYNNDGKLDLFIPSYFIHEMAFGNLLFQNEGDLQFTDMATEAGLSEGFHDRGAAWVDYDRDGFIDVFISEGNTLYRNRGDGTFEDTSRAAGIKRLRSNCGTWGDYDNDGYPDLYIATDHAGVLYHNNGDGTFTDVTDTSKTQNAFRATGADWGDYDNDGNLDLYVVNASRANRLFHNNGDGTFRDLSDAGGVTGKPYGSGSDASFIDYNNDGFLDLFVANGAGPDPGPYLLFQNNGNANHWLKLQLVGKESNAGGIGAKVTVVAGTSTFYRQYFGQHCMVQNHVPVHFGLRGETTASSIVIDWPSGVHQELDNIAADQMITVTEP